VSTEDGIYRYDGDRFEAFATEQGIPSNSGVAFGDAPDGSLLAGGSIGLYRLSGNRFEKIPVDFNTIAWAQGYPIGWERPHLSRHRRRACRTVFPTRASTIWHARFPQPAGTSGQGAFAILVDGDAVWYGCGQQLCRMDALGTQVFGRESGLPGQELQVILKDGAGNLWVRARNAGVFEWPAGKAKFQRPQMPFSLENIGGVPTVDSDGRFCLQLQWGC